MAVAIAQERKSYVVTGDETTILHCLDDHLRSLPPGVIVTWNGARFDLPFISDRARLHNIDLGLHLVPDTRTRSHRPPLRGHDGGYHASWFEHTHLDAYALYRSDVGASLGIPCGLKSLARMARLTPVEVDRTEIHNLSPEELDAYVASDAELARELALRRWPTARLAIDVL